VRAAALVTSIGLGYVLLDFAPPAKAMTAPLAQCADGGASAAGSTEIAPVVEDGKIKWTPFNAALLDAELARGRPVFVDFTADWCVNCKTNDRLFIEVDQIRADLTKSKILPMKVDLTTDEAQDEMKPLMDKLGRAAIPIYVVYHPDKTYDLLPESITTAMLSESLNKASAKFPPDGFKALSRPNAASSAAPSTAAPSTAAPSAASSASAPAPAPSISASP
jgi:thiol-disulfide isomerase/thioredoxin